MNILVPKFYMNISDTVFELFQVVGHFSGQQIGKPIALKNETLDQFPWLENFIIECQGDAYIVTCQYYWHNVTRLEFPTILIKTLTWT